MFNAKMYNYTKSWVLFLNYSILFLIVNASKGEANSSVADFLSSKVTQYIKKFNPIQNSYGSRAAETRGDEYQSVYVSTSDGSYGHSKGYGGHHGGYGHGAITLDPVSIISLLALGAFLINNILQLLRANQPPASGRSLDVSDINIPLDLSDIGAKNGDVIGLGLGQSRDFDEDNEPGAPSFSQFFANVGSLYYLHPKKRNICIKKVVCNYLIAQQSREDTQGSFKSRIFDFMLSAITRFVAPEINGQANSGMCQKFNKYCSEKILHDAKVSTENKVYSTVTNFVSNFAIQKLLSG